jgi:hypothetical protein
MKTQPSQSEADEYLSLDGEAATEDEYSEADALDHELSIAETAAATAPRFYARLRTELAKRGLSYAALPKFTQEGDTPPCFKAADVPFEMWLSSASLLRATVPYRFDMPAEPNYCYDCRSAFKQAAVKAGTCQFPHLKFERVQTVIRDERQPTFEVETVGVSRNPELIYEEDDE